MTIPTQLVLRALLADPAQERYGEIGAAAGLPSGTIHPSLARAALAHADAPLVGPPGCVSVVVVDDLDRPLEHGAVRRPGF